MKNKTLKTVLFVFSMLFSVASFAGYKQVGLWAMTDKVDVMTDSHNFYASIDSVEQTSDSFRGNISLNIRCMDNKTDVFIVWNDFLVEEGPLRIRLDKEEPKNYDYGLSSDDQATFIGNPISFLKSIENKTKIVAQFTPYREAPVTVVFVIPGIKQVIAEERKFCKW